MATRGLLHRVDEEPSRGFLAADYDAGATEVSVEPALPFLAGVERVVIAGSSYTLVAVGAEDENAPAALNLDPGLAVALEAGEPVDPNPSTSTTWGLVEVAGDDEWHRVLIGQELQDVSDLELGQHEPPKAVEFEDRGRGPELTWVEGRVEREMPPGAGQSDGDAPATSPLPVTLGGVRQVFVRWDGIVNPDLVQYEVHVADAVSAEGLVAPVAGDPVTLAATVAGTMASVTGLPSGELFLYDRAYQFAVIATDADGAAAASPWVAGQLDRLASGDIVAGAVTAEHLEALLVLASQIQVGGLIEIAPPTNIDGQLGGGIVVKDPADPSGEPLVRLHPDGNRFRGEIVADILTVLQDLTVQGQLRLASQGGSVLENGVSDPPSGPVWNTGPLQVGWPAVADGYAQRGLCWDDDGSVWRRLLVPTSGEVNGRARVQSIGTDGLVKKTVNLGKLGSVNPSSFNAVAVFGGEIISFAAHGALWYPVKWSAEGGPLKVGSEFGVKGRPTLVVVPEGLRGHNQDAELMVAGLQDRDDGLMLFVYSLPADSLRRGTGFGAYVDLPSTALTGLAVDTADNFGVDPVADEVPFFLSSGEEVWGFTRVKNAQAKRRAVTDFVMPASAISGGFAWDGGKFASTHGPAVLYHYSGYYGGDEKWWATYADTASGKTTRVSPVMSGMVPNRHYATLTLRPAPRGVNYANVWVGYGVDDPGIYYQRSESHERRTMILSKGKDTSGSTALPASNTLGGAPHTLVSEVGGFTVRGDGSGSWPLLDQVRDFGWYSVSFENGWSNFDSADEPVRSKAATGGKYVELGGLAGGGTANATIFTLPEAHRPKYRQLLRVLTQNRNTGAASTGTAHTHSMTNAAVRLSIGTDGSVKTEGAATGWVSLQGIRFPRD